MAIMFHLWLGSRKMRQLTSEISLQRINSKPQKCFGMPSLRKGFDIGGTHSLITPHASMECPSGPSIEFVSNFRS